MTIAVRIIIAVAVAVLLAVAVANYVAGGNRQTHNYSCQYDPSNC